MQIFEKLDDNLSKQLYVLYKLIWFTQGRELSDIKDMLENSYLTLAFTENQKLIGFCRVISDGVYKAFLFDVIVAPLYQNKGMGKIIMENLLKHNKLRKIKHIELYCPDKIALFYEKLGFEIRTSHLMRLKR